MSDCYLGVVIGQDGEGTVACAAEGDDAVECLSSRASELDAAVRALARGRPARVCVRGAGRAALEAALSLARLPAAEVVLLRPARQGRKSEPATTRASRLAREARRVA